MLDSTSLSTLLLLGLASLLLLSAMFYPSRLLKWLQRKRYQYEVTFSLYMLTSTEKFILNSVLFLLLSLFIIAASLYLPEHIAFMSNRMLYYFSGDSSRFATQAAVASTQALTTSTPQVLAGGEAIRLGAGREL